MNPEPNPENELNNNIVPTRPPVIKSSPNLVPDTGLFIGLFITSLLLLFLLIILFQYAWNRTIAVFANQPNYIINTPQAIMLLFIIGIIVPQCRP
jgi:hypothetical protein